MNVPTHYNVLNDEAILQDLYARNFHGDPLLEYVCQRWELLVEGDAELELELAEANSAMENAEDERDRVDVALGQLAYDLSKFEAEITTLRKQNTALMQQYVRSA